MKLHTKLLSISLIGALLLTAVGCSNKDDKKDSADKTPKKITVVLDWFPNTNHTGLYVAKEKEYYKAQGLDVDIIQAGEGATSEQMVASGKADFAISYQENVTVARDKDIPVVSVGAIIQHNTSAFASLKKDNIKSPKDFEGKRYGGWGSESELAVIAAVMEKSGADVKKMQNITLGQTDFFKSIGKDADFEWVYYGWDGIEAKRQNIDLNFQFLKDLDPRLDHYSPVIITSEKNVNENKELVKGFMKATSEGYDFAIKSPEDAANILIKAAPELNKDLVIESQKWLSTKYKEDAPRWGEQKESVWANYSDFLVENKLIKKDVDTKKAFTNEFLPNN